MNEFIAIPLVIGSIGTAFILAIRATFEYLRARALMRLQADTMTKIIDKLGSSPELAAWLQSGDLKRFFESADLTETQSRRVEPHGRILTAAQVGIVMIALGCGLIAVSSRTPDLEPWAVGVVASSVGAGFLLAAGASFILSRQLGLISDESAVAPRDRD